MKLDRQKIMEYVAQEFNVEPGEDGQYDIDDYDWTAGCSFNGTWLNLKNVVLLIEDILEQEGFT